MPAALLLLKNLWVERRQIKIQENIETAENEGEWREWGKFNEKNFLEKICSKKWLYRGTGQIVEEEKREMKTSDDQKNSIFLKPIIFLLVDAFVASI